MSWAAAWEEPVLATPWSYLLHTPGTGVFLCDFLKCGLPLLAWSSRSITVFSSDMLATHPDPSTSFHFKF